MLGNFDSKVEEISDAKNYAKNYPMILSSIKALEELDQMLKLYDIDNYVSYELGLISNYHYYTGIIFAGYTLGTGEPIVNGGRYDKLLQFFGKDAPAIGFAIVVDQLRSALSRQKIEIQALTDTNLIVYSEASMKEAIAKATELRMKGHQVTLLKRNESKKEEDYESYALQNQIEDIMYMN